MVNVAFLIGFFWLLFAIIGVQSFKSSFRRTCVWYEDIENVFTNSTNTIYAQNSAPNYIQFCGGYRNATNDNEMPWLKASNLSNGTTLTKGADKPKGYLCPKHSLCIESTNPYNGTVNFDNVLQSLQLVFVIMSSNTFSDLLYYTTDSEFLPAALCRFRKFFFGISADFNSLRIRVCDNESLAYESGEY